MTSRSTLLRLLCVAILMVFVVEVPANATEVVYFQSAVLPPSPFKLRLAEAQGREIEQEQGFPIWGHLSRPEGSGPFPAIVLMHGCSGIFPSDVRWAEILTELGYVTLILDSFRPRSVFDICKGQAQVASPAVRALDAYGALAYLRSLAFVDADQIGLVGWSHGGISALAAVSRFGIADRLPERFEAAIAFYPYCLSDRSFDLPLLILIGEADDWTPPGLCQELKVRSQEENAAIQVITYPGAYHAFDVPELQEGFSVEGASGERHWLQYDEEAHRDSVERVKSFLAQYLSRE